MGAKFSHLPKFYIIFFRSSKITYSQDHFPLDFITIGGPVGLGMFEAVKGGSEVELVIGDFTAGGFEAKIGLAALEEEFSFCAFPNIKPLPAAGLDAEPWDAKDNLAGKL